MRTQSYDQYVAVTGLTFEEAVDKLNCTIREHAKGYIESTMIDACNYLVHFKEYVNIPETIEDEMEISGKQIYCVDCPHYRPILKDDGTPDKRTKFAMCARWGHKIYQDGTADDKCYRILRKEAELEE